MSLNWKWLAKTRIQKVSLKLKKFKWLIKWMILQQKSGLNWLMKVICIYWCQGAKEKCRLMILRTPGCSYRVSVSIDFQKYSISFEVLRCSSRTIARRSLALVAWEKWPSRISKPSWETSMRRSYLSTSVFSRALSFSTKEWTYRTFKG